MKQRILIRHFYSDCGTYSQRGFIKTSDMTVSERITLVSTSLLHLPVVREVFPSNAASLMAWSRPTFVLLSGQLSTDLLRLPSESKFTQLQHQSQHLQMPYITFTGKNSSLGGVRPWRKNYWSTTNEFWKTVQLLTWNEKVLVMPGRTMPGYWRGVFWTLDSGGTKRFLAGHGTLDQPCTPHMVPGGSTCVCLIWMRNFSTSLVVSCGGCYENEVRSPLLRAAEWLYDWSRNLVCIASSKTCFWFMAQGPGAVQCGNHWISSMLYADDVVLLALSS